MYCFIYLIKFLAKPEAADWRNKPILFYDKLAQLFGKDRATGEHAETSTEIRARKVRNNGNMYPETIEEIDNLVSANEVTLESFEVGADIHLNTSPQRPSPGFSQDSSSSKSKKRARKVMEDDTPMGDIALAINRLVGAHEKSTFELVKQMKNTDVETLWAQLEEIGVEPASLPHVYMHLSQHPDSMKAFIGVPVLMRKEMLPFIV